MNLSMLEMAMLGDHDNRLPPAPVLTETVSEHHAAKLPRVSIGMPVFNGEKYIVQAIESLLAQTFMDFELIISDNASSDQTEAICQRYAAQDPRIRYYRQEVNRGAAWNHNRVFELSSAEYFKWQSYDDLCQPTFVEKCVEILDREPSVVLCYSQFSRIDAEGRCHVEKPGGWKSIASSSITGLPTPHERFRALLHRRDACEEIYGVMRAKAARETRLLGAYSQSDDNFVAELALRGQFWEVPEPLFLYRLHPENATKIYRSHLQRMLWNDPNVGRRLNLPFFRQFREYLGLIRRAPLSLTEQMQCCGSTIGWAWRFRHRLWEDFHGSILYGRIVPWLKQNVPWVRSLWRRLKKMVKVISGGGKQRQGEPRQL